MFLFIIYFIDVFILLIYIIFVICTVMFQFKSEKFKIHQVENEYLILYFHWLYLMGYDYIFYCFVVFFF